MINRSGTENRVLVVVLAVIAFANPVLGADGPEGAKLEALPEALVQRGIESYDLQLDGSSAEVRLKSPTEAVVGTLNLAWDVEEGTLAELDLPEAHLLLLVNSLTGEIQLSDLRSQTNATVKWTEGGWRIDEASRRLLDLYADEIAVMAEAHDHVYYNHIQTGSDPGGRIVDRLESERLPGTTGDKVFNNCPPECLGPTVRGQTLVAWARSTCCAKATQDANNQCTNQYCWGCCQTYSCDAYCAVGDYLCFPCGVTGRMCSGIDHACEECSP